LSVITTLCSTTDALVTNTETTEFIELYDGGIGNTPLDNLVVVLFNGELDQSYKTFDLEGFMTNAEGYFVIGGDGLTNADIMVSETDWLADGTDAVALYMGESTAFPFGTPVTSLRLLDAVVYDTDDASDTGLLSLLNQEQPQINEGGADAENHSIGRCENGAGGPRNTNHYRKVAPTPGTANHCQADLSLTLTDSVDPINTGTEFSYILTINNVGPDVASHLQVENTLFDGVNLVSASGTDWTCNPSEALVVCQLANLAVGVTTSITK
jgi:hypothetical protein